MGDSQEPNQFFKLRLRNAPKSAKVLIGGFLLSLSLAYVYAIGNILLVVGYTPRDIAIHYYGADQVIKAEAASLPQGEEEFSLEELETPASNKPVLGPRPSFKNLVAEGHFHLFGMTSFFFGLTLLGLFTGVSEKIKILLVGTPYVAIVFDNLSFMATRFLGPAFAYLTAVSGAFMGLSFSALWILILFEILKNPEVK